MGNDATQARITNYKVSFTPPGGTLFDHGYVDKVTPNLKTNFKELKVGTIGDVVLDQMFISLAGTVTIECRQVVLPLLKILCPWWTSGSVAMFPATPNKRLYSYAGLLTLHPLDKTDTTEDLTFVKAAPIAIWPARDGNDWDKLAIEYQVFPDQVQLPSLVYGYVGPSPT